MDVDINSSSVVFTINFGNHNEAEIAKRSLEVDPEPSRSNTRKDFSVLNNNLRVEILSPDVRELRIAVNSFMDHLHLVTQTIQRFGPQVHLSKKFCMNNHKN